jgi:hypothetical protein
VIDTEGAPVAMINTVTETSPPDGVGSDRKVDKAVCEDMIGSPVTEMFELSGEAMAATVIVLCVIRKGIVAYSVFQMNIVN